MKKSLLFSAKSQKTLAIPVCLYKIIWALWRLCSRCELPPYALGTSLSPKDSPFTQGSPLFKRQKQPYFLDWVQGNGIHCGELPTTSVIQCNYVKNSNDDGNISVSDQFGLIVCHNSVKRTLTILLQYRPMSPSNGRRELLKNAFSGLLLASIQRMLCKKRQISPSLQ